MNGSTNWNDAARDELRERIRHCILGELRLAKNDNDSIIQQCREVYIDDECPEEEREVFVQFVEEELERASAELSIEQASWPSETDCDRLDDVEAKLRERGILLWQASPCCDSCTGSELPDRIDVIEKQQPGFRDRVRGYAFFIDQNMAEMLAEDEHLAVYLAYGWFSPDESKVDPQVYRANALGIAREVCDCLREHGFEPEWNGDFSKKVGVSLNWHRRTLLH